MLFRSAETRRLRFGHHGANHPVQDLGTGKVQVTAQNHEVTVVGDSFPEGSGFAVSQRNLNDGSVEGLRHRTLPIETVQYHPEGSPGPLDAVEVFDRFLDRVRPDAVALCELEVWPNFVDACAARGIPVTVICDSMAALALSDRNVSAVVVGADRIAANGDTANKVGTYSVAVIARAHGVPFYVAAPSSTFDFNLPTGAGIPIEERKSEEITEGFGTRTVPVGVAVWNPAFDVTPAELIAGIITERGVILAPTTERIREVLS